MHDHMNVNRDELAKDYLIKIIFHVLYGLGLLVF